MSVSTKSIAKFAAAAIAAFFFGSDQTLAHEEFRVIGTLTKHEGSEIAVQSRDGKTTAIRIDRQTVINKDGSKTDTGALSAGISVVVDALGDSEEDLLAIEIRIVPPIGSR
jgi:hypothetical protein